MIDALSARDAQAMRAVLAGHLANKLDVVIEQLRAASPTQAATVKA